MSFMALQADERLVLLQQVVGNCSVRIVADGAVFRDRRMLKHKWPLVARMAVDAEVVGAFFGYQTFRGMRIVAAAAIHLAFLDGMVRREHGLGHLFLMAVVAKLGILLLQGHFAAGMNRMAIGACHIGQGMLTVCPVDQVTAGMAFHADCGRFLGQHAVKIENFATIRINMQAAATMAGFASFGAAHIHE